MYYAGSLNDSGITVKNARDTVGSSHGQQTIQGACVSETAVHDHGRRLNQREFRPMAEVPFRPARQLSEYKGKGASASREPSSLKLIFLPFLLIECLQKQCR